MHPALRPVLVLAAVNYVCSLSAAAATFRALGSIGETIAPSSFISRGVYDLTLGVQAGGGVNYDQDGDATTPSIHAQANSVAGVGGLRAHGFVQLIKPFSGGDPHEHTYLAEANALATHQITITGPAGNVTTALNIHLDGQQSVGTSNTPGTPFDPRASSFVGLNFQLDGSTIGVGQRYLQVTDGDPQPLQESGLLVGFTGDATLTTDSFTVPTNTPLTLFMAIYVTAGATVIPTESYTAGANVDFGNTLTFATDRPVFNLPNGYTANSTDAGIVNNMFVPMLEGDYDNSGAVDAADYVLWRNGDSPDDTQAGYDLWKANFGKPPGSGAAVAIPEPSTLFLTIAALAARSTRRRKDAS